PTRRPLLVYNSGRLVDDMERLVAEGRLHAPDYYIGGVGTRITDVRSKKALDEFSAHIRVGWDRKRAEAVAAQTPGIRPQPDEFQEEFKSSWYLDNATADTLHDLERRLADAGLEAIVVYSSA